VFVFEKRRSSGPILEGRAGHEDAREVETMSERRVLVRAPVDRRTRDLRIAARL